MPEPVSVISERVEGFENIPAAGAAHLHPLQVLGLDVVAEVCGVRGGEGALGALPQPPLRSVHHTRDIR